MGAVIKPGVPSPALSPPVPVFEWTPRKMLRHYFVKNGRLYFVLDFDNLNCTLKVENCETNFTFSADQEYFGKGVTWIHKSR